MLSIGERPIGQPAPCFIIAEAGVNHNGEVELAHRLIDIAHVAGADAIKFQTFNPQLLATPEAMRAAYQIENTGETGSQLAMLEKLALPLSAYPALKQHAEDVGLIFLSTPFDEESGAFLHKLGVPAFKISSGDLTNLPLLFALAAYNKPLLISTGMATLAEVKATIGALTDEGINHLALFHCVSNYPSRPQDSNLKAMDTLRYQFNVPVGWSDHTMGYEISIAAVAMGAELIEKHITLDRNLPGPDHQASLQPEEFITMVRAIRQVESAIGDGIKRPIEAEAPIAEIGRRGLYWRASLPAGATVKAEHFISLRPAKGISPMEQPQLIGRTLSRAVEAFDLVCLEDFVQS